MQFKRICKCFFAGVIAVLLLAIGPVVFIRRNLSGLFTHWQEAAFYILCLLGCLLAASFGFNLTAGHKETRRQRWLIWGGAAFTLLFMASIALCEKISVGSLDNEIWRDLGLVLFTLGFILRIWAIATLGTLHSGFVTIQTEHRLITSGPYVRIRHPSYLGFLISVAALPMIFGTWFPMLALPGIFVIIKWRILDEEALLAEHFGSTYDEYKERTWRLIPTIY